MTLAIEINVFGRFEHFEDALLREGRTKDDGEVGKGGHTLTDGVFEMGDDLLVLLLHRVPLVDHHHQTLVVALDKLEDVHILAFDAAGGVNEQDAHVGVFDGADGAHHAVELKVFRHLVLLADTRRVHEVEVEAELVVAREDGVACGAGNVGDDVAVFSDEGIDERTLAGVGTSHHRETRDVGLALVGRL